MMMMMIIMVRIRIKDAEKILKYKDLIKEIQPMLNVKAKLISVISGATGTLSESFRHNI
jgi:hypothetical protein